MFLKLFIFIFIIGCTSCNTKTVSQNINCEETIFYGDNSKNDTSKVIFLNAVVFDTTACMIHGYLIDRFSSQPVVDASVTLQGKSNSFQTKTNDKGEFKLFNNPLCNEEVWDLNISHSDYRCSKIKYSQLNGGVYLKIKLQSIK